MKIAFLFYDKSKYFWIKSKTEAEQIDFFFNHLYLELILCNYCGVTLSSGQDFVAC